MTNPDPRHPSEREADMLLWERLFAGHSPAEEVRWSAGLDAEAIAAAAWTFYTVDEDDWRDLDRDATIESLTRTLRYQGGAK